MPSAAFDLGDLRGQPCALVLGASPKDTVCQEQMRQFTDQEATCTDRHLLIVEALRLGGGAAHHPTPGGFRKQPLRETDAAALHDRFGAGARFLFILLDAEGVELHRDDAPVKLTAICRHLDASSSH